MKTNIYKKELEKKPYGNLANILFCVLAIMLCVYQIYTATRPIFDPLIQQAIHLGTAWVLVFLHAMSVKCGERKKELWYQAINIILLTASVIVILFVIINFRWLLDRVGLWDTKTLIVAITLVLLVLETTRRTFGLSLPILVIIFLLYAVYGKQIPGILYHSGFSWSRLVTSLTINMTGMWGTILQTSSTFIAMFMIFGALLEASGAGDFFIKLAMALGGKTRSGPAQAAIISSSLVGSINGSATANVAATGVFTIPLMKSRGYDPYYAGAVEAVASTGGMVMPPVMGVAAFIMAEITGIPYSQIALASLVPALLYFFTVAMSVHLRALKNNLKPLPSKEIPLLKKVLLEGGHFLLPLLAIVLSFFLGYSVIRSSLHGIYCLGFVFILRETIRDPKYLIKRDFWVLLFKGFISGAKNIMPVATACAAMGIMTQSIVVTGIAMKIIMLVKTFSYDMSYMALLIIAIISIFFGMGVPTTASYIVIATLGAPVLIEFGFPILSVHLFIYYLTIMANITPPIASAALVGSRIADAPYMKTGWTAWRLGLPGFVLPFTFIYNQELLLKGSFISIALTILTTMFAMFCLAAFFEGWFFSKLNFLERGILFLATISFIYPEQLISLVGYGLFFVVVLMQRAKAKRVALEET